MFGFNEFPTTSGRAAGFSPDMRDLTMDGPRRGEFGRLRPPGERLQTMYRRPPEAPGQPPQQSPWSGILQQLFGLLDRLRALLGGSGGAFFQNATASSTGDPHLAFQGSESDGETQSEHFDSMTSHADLLDSSSFDGGFRLATTVTQPDARGITYNDTASIETQDGNVSVALDRHGDAYVTQDGRRRALADGTTLDLGDGENVTRNTDGSLVVRLRNQNGGTIDTTMRSYGAGVDVSAQATNVELGGGLLRRSDDGLGALEDEF